MRAERWQRGVRRRVHCQRTVTPPRSNGMLRTIVVRVRAIPGVAFSRASNSSRCCVERVTTLQTKRLLARDRVDLADLRHLARAGA